MNHEERKRSPSPVSQISYEAGPNSAPGVKKEVSEEEKQEIKALLSRLSKAEQKMKQAKADIFTDASKRVTKGNILKKKNELLREELQSSQSSKKAGGSVRLSQRRMCITKWSSLYSTSVQLSLSSKSE